mgnify:FL=1
MKIIDWKLIVHTLNPWHVVVLQKHISGRKSIFYGQTLIYMGNPRSGYSRFRLKRKVTHRWVLAPDGYLPKIHHIASIPLSISWPFGDTQWLTAEQAMPTINIMWWEYFASDSYTDITPENSDPDHIELEIDIPVTDFAFVKYEEFNDFLERQLVARYLNEQNWIEVYMPVEKAVTNSSTSRYWWRTAALELIELFREPTTVHLWHWPMANFTQTSLIYKLQWGSYGNLDPQTEWNVFPITYCRWEAPRGKFTVQDLIFDTHNTPMYDECLLSIWQLINFRYYPASSDDTIPTEYYIGTTPRPSTEEVEYVSEGECWTIVEERRHRTGWVTPDLPRWRANLGRPIPADDSYFISNYTLSSVEEGQAPPMRNTFQSTAQMLRDLQQFSPQPAVPVDYDLQIGDTVYIKPEMIGNKFHRKNREYTVLSYWGNDSSNNQVYRIQPSNKKSFNGEWAIEMRSKHIIKAEKIWKRKFSLDREFGKYKEG